MLSHGVPPTVLISHSKNSRENKHVLPRASNLGQSSSAQLLVEVVAYIDCCVPVG